MEREALKLALEALEEAHYKVEHKQDAAKREQAITAIKEALAQPAQDPVAHVYLFDHEGRPRIAWDKTKGIKIGDKLYTAPPQREWVGLTDEDCKGMSAGDKMVAMWANRILKERNS